MSAPIPLAPSDITMSSSDRKGEGGGDEERESILEMMMTAPAKKNLGCLSKSVSKEYCSWGLEKFNSNECENRFRR